MTSQSNAEAVAKFPAPPQEEQAERQDKSTVAKQILHYYSQDSIRAVFYFIYCGPNKIPERGKIEGDLTHVKTVL